MTGAVVSGVAENRYRPEAAIRKEG